MSSTAPAEIALPSGRQTAYAVIASLFGWGLDLFDLFILLYVAPAVGRVFFPSDAPMLSLAGVYASFAVTLLMRPLGSALFGSYADRIGRKRALMVAVVGVGLATAVFGVLPSVAQIGWTATGLFLVFRLVQGIFVGGVVASSHTIGTESVPEKWRGTMSGAVGGAGSAIGGLLASLVFFLVTQVAPGDQFAAWGWRLMFLSGIVTSILGVVLFRGLEESPAFVALEKAKAAKRATAKSPLGQLFAAPYLSVLLVNVILTTGAGAGYYLTSGYLPSFLKLVNKTPDNATSLILISGNLAAAVGAIGFGALSQVIGRKPVLLGSAILRVITFPLIFLGMGATTDVGSLALYVLALTFIANGSYGPILIFLNERFPTSMRASGTGVSWNIGFAIGGMMPTFVSAFAQGPQSLPMLLAIFSTAFSVLYVIGALLIPESRGNLTRQQTVAA